MHFLKKIGSKQISEQPYRRNLNGILGGWLEDNVIWKLHLKMLAFKRGQKGMWTPSRTICLQQLSRQIKCSERWRYSLRYYSYLFSGFMLCMAQITLSPNGTACSILPLKWKNATIFVGQQEQKSCLRRNLCPYQRICCDFYTQPVCKNKQRSWNINVFTQFNIQ